MRLVPFLPLVSVLLAAQAVEPLDAARMAALREEGLKRSQVMATLHQLTDVHGPRLMASPSYKAAAQWAVAQFQAWGADKAWIEPFPFGHAGWTNERCAVHALAPYQDPLVVEPVAWTPSTRGAVQGEVVRLAVPEEPLSEELDAFLEGQAAAVKGKVVFVGVPKPLPVLPGPARHRHEEEALQKRFDPAQAQGPGRIPGRPGPKRAGALTTREMDQRIDAFLVKAGALARVNDAGLRNGQIRAFNNRTYDLARAVPTVVMRREDYGRLWRLMEGGQKARLELDIRNRTHPRLTEGLNVVAELTGSEKPEEVVLLGAHLDAWHTATGATDNAASCSVMMEVLRLLKATGAKPKRTVRIVLFDGEEQGLLGSQAYVKAHFGMAEDPKPAFDRLIAYINMDGGAGQLRGLSIFGPPEASQVLRELLAPFKDLGAVGAIHSATRLPKPDYADVTSFSHAGLPAIGVVQDGLEYGEYTWHTTVDSYERVPAEDVARTATILASVALHLADRPEPLPRFTRQTVPPLPKP